MKISTGTTLGRRICEILKIDPEEVRSISLICEAPGTAEVRVVRLVTVIEGNLIGEAIANYKLVPKRR